MKKGDRDAPADSGETSRARALGIAMLFAGVVAVGVWLIADDAEMTVGDTATPAGVGAAVGLVVAVIGIVLAVSRFRASISRIRTPSALFLGGLGLWAWLLLEPTILIGLLVGLGAALFFFLVLGAFGSVAYLKDPAGTALAACDEDVAQ
jgi:hypothetical protein